MTLNKALKQFESTNILVVGGAGFIGSHLLETLIPYANKLISLDNYLTGNVSNHFPGVAYVKGDASDISGLIDETKFDYIFHFGEYSRVEQSLDEPYLALSNIYKSFPAVLNFWKQSDAKLIYSGSSTKFADNGAGIHLSPYTAAKAFNTELLADFAKWYDLKFSTVYFNNVYGGRELSEGKYATVIGKYKKIVSKNLTKLPVTLPGTQRRSFTHINDIISGIILAAAFGYNTDYQIGSDKSFSVLEVCRLFGCEPNFTKGSNANRLDSKVENSKIKKLGWIEGNSLDVYIGEFLRDFNSTS